MKTWDEMTARERDELVAREVMERDPEIVHIVTNDGGESACATTGGPWQNEGDLRAWLERHQAKGYHLDYEIGTWERYPHYSTDIAEAWEVVEKMESDGWGLTLYTKGAYTDEGLGPSNRRGCWFARQIEGYHHETASVEWGDGEPTIPEAICLASLRAKGVKV